MKSHSIKRAQTKLQSAKARWEQLEAERAAERQRQLKQAFLERRAA